MGETIHETIGRQALLAFSNQYPGMADALMELIDNPFDYRKGRHLTIQVCVDKKRSGMIDVFDHGGEGMDVEALRDWIQWGKGHAHASTDIGQYHIGGKLAAMYLAESIEIVCRKAGSSTAYKFLDPHWGSRTEPFAANVEPLDLAALRWIDDSLATVSLDVGFSRFRLRKLKPHRYEPAILVQRLANVYSHLIEVSDCQILVDGQAVEPLKIPVSSAYQDKTIDIPNTPVAKGLRVRGRLWVMDRDRLTAGRGATVKAGVRTLFNGKLVVEGETFGHNLAGKGNLQRLIGEIHITGIQPTTTKDNWQRGSDEWSLLESYMHKQMQPLVRFLSELGEARVVSREQRKSAARVRRQLEAAFAELGRLMSGHNGHFGEVDTPQGRLPPRPALEEPSSQEDEQHKRVRREIENRTPPPDNPVGRLLRRFGGTIPEIDFADIGRGVRSQWADERCSKIIINVSYPVFEEDSDPYIAETVVLHILTDDEAFQKAPLSRAVEELNRILWVWEDVRQEVS